MIVRIASSSNCWREILSQGIEQLVVATGSNRGSRQLDRLSLAVQVIPDAIGDRWRRTGCLAGQPLGQNVAAIAARRNLQGNFSKLRRHHSATVAYLAVANAKALPPSASVDSGLALCLSSL
jgi:hypothetical protein